MTDKNYELLKLFISEKANPETDLISILHYAQEIFGFLSEETLNFVSKESGVPISQVYGVATFYNYFSFKVKGENKIVVCIGTACYINGAQALVDKLESTLNIKVGEVTEDKKFSLDTARCLGACALGPVIKINETIYNNMTVSKIEEILSKY